MAKFKSSNFKRCGDSMGLLMIFFVPKDNHNVRLRMWRIWTLEGKLLSHSKQEEIAASPTRDSHTSARRSSSKEISTKWNRETSSNRPNGNIYNKYVNEFKVKYDNSFIGTNLQAFLEENEESIVNSVNYESNFVEFVKGESKVMVKGRLMKNLEYWKI